jgi:hypothetical protein
MQIIERPIVINSLKELAGLRCQIRSVDNEVLIRFVVERISNGKFYCSINTIKGLPFGRYPVLPDIAITQKLRNDGKFRVALVIPTGLGASVGGHAGDGGATARLMASVCDKLVTHPNVVNASDFNEMTENTLYVEGHMLTQYLLGNIGLQEVRQNRVLVIVDGSADPIYIDSVINVVNAARVTYGFNCPEIIVLKKPFIMESRWSHEFRSSGVVSNLEELFSVLHDRKGTYDAVAITSLIGISDETRDYYYRHGGVNPWGGVEAMLTHTISHCFQVPCAHAPMMESQEIEKINFGVVDPRCAAETVSCTYFPCVLKGLHRAPQISETSPDVSCLVIPRRCLGIPMLAAQQRGIPIIAVNDHLLVDSVDCTDCVDVIEVDNYIEAAGAVVALRSGIDIASLRRPVPEIKVTR